MTNAGLFSPYEYTFSLAPQAERQIVALEEPALVFASKNEIII